MSKFIDALEVIFRYNGYKPVCNPISALSLNVEKSIIPYDMLHEYEFKVRYTVRQHCRPSELPHVTEMVKRVLLEEVYSDFRSKLLDLQASIYNDDRQECLEKIKELFKEVQGE